MLILQGQINIFNQFYTKINHHIQSLELVITSLVFPQIWFWEEIFGSKFKKSILRLHYLPQKFVTTRKWQLPGINFTQTMRRKDGFKNLLHFCIILNVLYCFGCVGTKILIMNKDSYYIFFILSSKQAMIAIVEEMLWRLLFGVF